MITVATGTVGEFEASRGRMFSVAYRLLGSATDAEDVVQDAYLRWHRADHDLIRSVPHWLVRVVTNLALNRLGSAAVRREQYVGPWLPEPVLTVDGQLGPMESAEQRESVSLALLIMMERLSPIERAVYVLREAFDYSHREIAEILDESEVNCRQILRRARQRMADHGRGTDVDHGEWVTLVERFLAAAGTGDLAGLESMMIDDITAVADGGGQVTAARNPVVGAAQVARYLAGALEKLGSGIEVLRVQVNGAPAVVVVQNGEVRGVFCPEVAGGRVIAIRIIANPDKLAYLTRQLSQTR